jgi:hypothetical protein
MPSYKDSPKPMRKSDPNPLFTEADDGYIVKAASPMERQRTADGSLHSMSRRSSVEPSGYDESLYLGEDKIDKSTKSVSAQMDRDDIDADEVVKAYMAKGRVAGADSDDEDEEKALTSAPKTTPKAPAPKNTDRNRTGGPNNTPRFGLNNLAPKK